MKRTAFSLVESKRSVVPAQAGIHLPQGFSLVELSIVLVIIGLLVGGVLSGQSLIHASQLRVVTTEYDRITTATQSFREKYFALPGDMPNATSYWGILAGTTGSDAACQSISAPGLPTCNGNGDGQIYTSVVAGDEIYRFWQHLANAGLIEGHYTGIVGSGAIPGTNFMASKNSSSTYWDAQFMSGVGDINNYTIAGANSLILQTVTQTFVTAGSFPLTPEDAWNIDMKMDDGLPGTGNIISKKGDATHTKCTSVAGIAPPGDTNSTYVLSNTNKDCTLFFLDAF